MSTDLDPIAAFYDRYPYPPPVTTLDTARFGDDGFTRAAHHLIWPARPVGTVHSVLVAGCGTSQAVRYALRHPAAHVVGIDVSASSIEHTRALADRYGTSNLDVHQLPIEEVDQLDERFDHIVCTGVLHHLADPVHGLRMLRGALASGGAITLMVYARYGRVGVYLLQEYCRRLGIGPSSAELADLVGTLRELSPEHPLSRLLRGSRDFASDNGIADALCNPRDRAYSVPELWDLLDRAGLRFGRWERQAPYLPDCGAISETPHASRIAARPPAEQFALLELFRGTITRHTVIAFAATDATSGSLDFTSESVDRWVPVPMPTATIVEERLPAGVAAALINRAHTEKDLVLFASSRESEMFRAIDGQRAVGELGSGASGFVERLWRHDLIALDTLSAGAP